MSTGELPMELLERLEAQVVGLIRRVQQLEQENGHLRSLLSREQATRSEVRDRVERLLKKVQEANIDK